MPEESQQSQQMEAYSPLAQLRQRDGVEDAVMVEVELAVGELEAVAEGDKIGAGKPHDRCTRPGPPARPAEAVQNGECSNTATLSAATVAFSIDTASESPGAQEEPPPPGKLLPQNVPPIHPPPPPPPPKPLLMQVSRQV